MFNDYLSGQYIDNMLGFLGFFYVAEYFKLIVPHENVNKKKCD